MMIYKNIYIQTLTQGCKHLIRNKQQASRVQIRKEVFKNNMTIWERLNIQPLVKKIEKKKLAWFEHLNRTTGKEKSVKTIQVLERRH